MAKQTQTSINLSNFIWGVANDLWGDFKHTDFSRIVIPLLLLRRLESVLAPTKPAVLQSYEQQKSSGMDPELYLPSVAGVRFFNTSKYDLNNLGATDTRANLEEYIANFSANVRLIFDEFGFTNTILELDKAKLLYRMVNHFATLDLSKATVSDRDMSNAYEDIIRKFAASINEKAGEFMSPRDIVHLTTKLVLIPDEEIFSESGVIRKVYDGACGVGGFLSDAISLIKDMSPTAKIVPFGQEPPVSSYLSPLIF
jgi:type I restriction enzyme M protein